MGLEHDVPSELAKERQLSNTPSKSKRSIVRQERNAREDKTCNPRSRVALFIVFGRIAFHRKGKSARSFLGTLDRVIPCTLEISESHEGYPYSPHEGIIATHGQRSRLHGNTLAEGTSIDAPHLGQYSNLGSKRCVAAMVVVSLSDIHVEVPLEFT